MYIVSIFSSLKEPQNFFSLLYQQLFAYISPEGRYCGHGSELKGLVRRERIKVQSKIEYSNDLNPEIMAALDLINTILSRYIFNSLRTVKQLGYVANSAIERELPLAGALITVQGSTEDPDYLDQEIEQALGEVEQYIKNISNEKFDSLKQNYQDRIKRG